MGTIGLGMAVGTVLGASTLPFYDQPGQHLVNVAIGASAGLLAGIGAGVHQRLGGNAPEEEYGSVSTSRSYLGRRPSQGSDFHDVSESQPEFLRYGDPPPSAMSARPVHPVLFWMPLVSLNW